MLTERLISEQPLSISGLILNSFQANMKISVVTQEGLYLVLFFHYVSMSQVAQQTFKNFFCVSIANYILVGLRGF
jgi:hypothetical protein